MSGFAGDAPETEGGKRPGATDGARGRQTWQVRGSGTSKSLENAADDRASNPMNDAAVLVVPAKRQEQLVPNVRHMLVVDPEERLVRLLSSALKSRGWRVDALTDSANGIEPTVLRTAYDLIVVDASPGSEGALLLYDAPSARPAPRVIVISDSAQSDWIVQCFNAGAVDYLRKPFHVAELIARIRAQFRTPPRPTVEAQRLMRRRGVTLDPLRHTADLGSERVDLTNREFTLLEYLVSHAGPVFTHEELAAAWGLTSDQAGNMVAAYVSRLRAKLGDTVIATVHGRGYTLVGGAEHAAARRESRLDHADDAWCTSDAVDQA